MDVGRKRDQLIVLLIVNCLILNAEESNKHFRLMAHSGILASFSERGHDAMPSPHSFAVIPCF